MSSPKPINQSMQHWNGHQLCAIDVETTGTDPAYHEILQICILPLNSNVEPRKDVMPFYIEIIPNHPERIEKEAMTKNKLDASKIMQRGFDSFKAVDMFLEWMQTLNLPTTKFGQPKRIIPLAHNWPFDKGFVEQWMGPTQFNEVFDAHYRDTMAVASFLNDRAGAHAEIVPYSKSNLGWMCNKNAIINTCAHDALQDCIATAALYKKLIYAGLFGVL
jgi:DNA polymerase III epsilon subunit-like protein